MVDTAASPWYPFKLVGSYCTLLSRGWCRVGWWGGVLGFAPFEDCGEKSKHASTWKAPNVR